MLLKKRLNTLLCQFSSSKFARTTGKLRPILPSILSTISTCILCHEKSLSKHSLCEYCIADLPKFSEPLDISNLLTWPAIDKLFKKRAFDQLIAIAPYAWPYNGWISQLKYQQKFERSDLLAFLLNQHYQQINEHEESSLGFDLVMAVPIHPKRWLERGFNQSHLIAKAFCQQANLTYAANFIERDKDTAQQVGQSGKARRQRLKRAFSLSERSNQQLNSRLINKEPFTNVLLIDDVITTGSTVNEISKLLKKNGVKRVTVATICISMPQSI